MIGGAISLVAFLSVTILPVPCTEQVTGNAGSEAFSLSGATVGQNYHFIQYDKTTSGLSYDGVKQIIQDSRGYIWAGTYKGLARFDGVRWINFDRDDFGTDSDYVSSLEEDRNGNIWAGTDEGVVLYNFNRDKFERLSASFVPSNRVYAIECSPEGKVYLGFRSEGLYSCDSGGENLTSLWKDSPAHVYRLASSPDGRLFVATYCDNLYLYRPDSGQPPEVLCDGFFATDNIEGLACDSKYLYVASKRHGLCRVGLSDFETKVLCTIPDDARPVNVGLSGGSVWFSTTNGVRRIDPVTGKVSSIKVEEGNPFSLSDNYVTCTVSDASRGLWIATDNGGICYSSPEMDRFVRFRCPGIVKSFAQDASSTVWVGTERNGLFQLDVSDGELKKYGDNKLPSDINALCSDGGNLWIGSHGGIYCLDTRSGRIRLFTNLFGNDSNLDNRTVSIFLSRENTLFAGTNIGVSSYDRSSGTFRQIACLDGFTVENMAQDYSGNIWMATYSQGVVVFNPISEKIVGMYNVRSGDSSIPEMTSSISIGGDGSVWVVGFSSGFFHKNGDDFVQYDKSSLPQLPSDVYFTAISDRKSHLWLSSDNGLVRFNCADNSVRVFTVADGLLDGKFKKGGMALNDGRILMGGESGFVMFNPDDFNHEESIGRVAMVSVSIDGHQPEPENFTGNPDLVSKITLAPRQRNISFDFAVPGYYGSFPGSVNCHMEGVDSNWREISASGSIEYYNLPKGRHLLKIASLSARGRLDIVHNDICIEVQPRFYESAAGILCIVLSALGAAFVIFLIFYRKGLSRQNKRHEAEEIALKEDLYHEKMSFFANVIHEIKTPLTLVHTPLQHLMLSDGLDKDSKEDVALINSNTVYLEKLVRELLEFISLEEHGYVLEMGNLNLAERLGFICSNYRETAKSRNLRLVWSCDCDDSVNAVDAGAFSKMVNNLLSNAVKYAETYIEVLLQKEGDFFRICFLNDGSAIPSDRREKIFSPFVHYGNESQGDNSFGIGLSYARKLARMHGGDITVSDREDLTEFVLSLPVRLVEENESALADNAEEAKAGLIQSKPLILIVEDNADLLGYLKRKLSADYLVTGVNSAEKALDKIRTNRVDLLLTDIGLKSISGIELCAKISADPALAHIPIIVLSAISNMETKIKCMENGASMYIEKPFSLDFLSSCIKGVLEKKKSIKSALVTGPSALEMVQAELPDRDEEFVCRLDRLVTDNISDPSFSNRQIEDSLGISRSSLNRRMKALLGITPNEYIRRKRLDVAARALRSGGVRVSEICYAVGFNSPSYFAKCFKDFYGVLPAEYAKGKNVAGIGEN